MSTSILLLIGFLLLFLGGELLVRGSVSLALRMKISTLVVGMTVVAFATSAPELFVSISAVLEGSSSIALGNALGSNIANIALVLGLTAIIFRVKIPKKISSINYPMMLCASLLVGLVLYFYKGVSFYFGIAFLMLLFIFIWILIVDSRKNFLKSANLQIESINENSNDYSLLKSIILLILGVFLLKYGAEFLVSSSKILAKNFGISDRIIAVTIVAIGTSIPELITSVIAALKKETNLAVGNLIGSNIFNILAVLGITACFKEISLDDNAILTYDYFYMILVTLFLGLLIYVFSKKTISKLEGFCLLLIYLLYMYNNFKLVI